MITHTHYLSIIITILAVSVAGIYSARYVHTAVDFSVGGRRMGPALVGGSLIGSFIGGTSTVGTAQMAYQHGISAIWFTLGGGLACVVLGLFLARPLREREVDTVPQFLAGTYGDAVRPWVALYTSTGMFIQIAAQGLAAAPLLTGLLPVSPQWAVVIFTGVLITYVLFGGFWGASLVGLFKLALICVTLFTAGVLSYKLFGGFAGARDVLPGTPWFSMFPGGFTKEIASGISVVAGFISTQTYLQPVFAGRDVRSARQGVILAGFLIALVGLAAAVIGLYMRATHPEIKPGSALPLFLLDYLNPWLGGAALATLLVSLVMTGAALCLGVGTILARDIYGRYRPGAADGEMLRISRLLVLLVAAASLIFILFNMDSMILKWAYLSMALRGVTVFLPLLGAVFAARFLTPATGVRAVALAPLLAVLWFLIFPGGGDPLYVGLCLSALFLTAGALRPGAASPRDF